jgi:hypothetical protein
VKTIAAVLLLAGAAAAQTLPVRTTASPQPMTFNERVLCSSPTGTPCTLSPGTTNVLTTNSKRGQCLLESVDVNPVFCRHGLGATSSTWDFVIKPASANSTYDGGSYSCSQAPAIWAGPISCWVSTTTTLAASAASTP